jgi:hypothetical protein
MRHMSTISRGERASASWLADIDAMGAEGWAQCSRFLTMIGLLRAASAGALAPWVCASIRFNPRALYIWRGWRNWLMKLAGKFGDVPSGGAFIRRHSAMANMMGRS